MAEGSAAPRFSIGRFSENELVLFDEHKQESWIIYPPRSLYDFLPVRRHSKNITLVEHHPWAPFTLTRDHQLRAQDACLVHGLACPANEAVQAAVDLGFDPFA
ncbi:MAG: hypothetical protein JOZ81_14270 [Chloroflexi bacterium]|nr:hypothetical protein [Chloroflexota bacterium]